MRRSRDRYMFEANSRSNCNSCVLVNAVRIRFELLLMETGDFGGGVGVLLRDGDSLGAETSAKGQKLMASSRDVVAMGEFDELLAVYYVIQEASVIEAFWFSSL